MPLLAILLFIPIFYINGNPKRIPISKKPNHPKLHKLAVANYKTQMEGRKIFGGEKFGESFSRIFSRSLFSLPKHKKVHLTLF